ncbi:TetR/AcrR family transcriptional regulator [Salana multivorans]
MPRGDAPAELILEVALRLFARNGVAGTSLQQIADALGVTKAAVYHHFRTKSAIVAAVLAPAFDEVARATAAARTVPDLAQRRRLLVHRELAANAVGNRAVYAVMLRDVAVGAVLADDSARAASAAFDELHTLLIGPGGTSATVVRVGMFLSGLAAHTADATLADMPDDELRAGIVEVGEALLGPW